MKARFSFSTRAWMLSITTGLILVPALRLMAQVSTAKGKPTVTAPAKSLKRDSRPRLKSAVQRELEKLYARDGKQAPELTIQAAAKEATSRKLRTSKKPTSKAASNRQPRSRKPSHINQVSAAKPATKKPATSKPATSKPATSKSATSKKVTKSKIPGLLNLKRLFPKTIQSTNKDTTARNVNSWSNLSRSRPAAAAARNRNRWTSNRRVVHKPATHKPATQKPATQKLATQKPVLKKNTKLTIKRTSQVVPEKSKVLKKRTFGVRQAAAETSKATRKESEIQRKLRELYNRDGREMPSMKLSDVVKNSTKANLQRPTATGQSKRSPRSTGSSGGRSSSFFKRFFPFGQKSRVSTTERRTPVVRRKANSSPSTKSATSKKSRLLPNGSSTAKQAVVKPVSKPVAARPKATPAAISAKAVDSKNVAETKPKAANPNDDLGNPFTEVSEDEADKNGNPFSGLTLDDVQPSKKPARLIPEGKQPMLPSETKVADSKDDVQKPAEPSVKVTPAKLADVQPKTSAADSKTIAEAKTQVQDENQAKLQRIAARKDLKGLKGFCAVALRDRRELLDTKPEFSATHESKVYYFSSAEAKLDFEKNPVVYIPVANGNDFILLTQQGKEIAGSLDHAVWFKDRLYLFSNSASMQTFVLAPTKFAASK